MRSQLLEDAPVGVCLRSADGAVQFQNRLCRGICGDVQGERCGGACERSRPRRAVDDAGAAELAKGEALHGRCCDVAVVESGGATVVLLLPLSKRVERLRRYFESMDLTERETDIAVLVALGKSNAEIILLTGLTKATVRTHLNHVHQKLPDEWLAKVRARRRR